MRLAPDDTWRPSPLNVGSLDTGISETILDINIYPISFHTTPEILQNPDTRVSRGGIYKTETQAEILQSFQEVEFTNQYNRQRYFKTLLQKSQEVEFIKQKYRHIYCKILKG